MESGNVVRYDTQEMRIRKTRQATLTSCRLIEEQVNKDGFRPWRKAFITLTLRDDVYWHPRMLSDFLQHVRKWFKAKEMRFHYHWNSEQTKRGRVHYHLIVWLPPGVRLPKPDKKGWWPYGMTNIQWARHAVAYLAKYLSKLDNAVKMPKGLRLHGCGGLDKEGARQRRWWLSPSYVREAFGEESNPFRAPGGGWINRVTGEFLPSRYKLIQRWRNFVTLVDLWAEARPIVA